MNDTTPFPKNKGNIRQLLSKWICVLLALVLTLSAVLVSAAGVWDGNGSSGGPGSTEEVSGRFWINDVGIGDALKRAVVF